MENDLNDLIYQLADHNMTFSEPQIKNISKQLFQGLAYCHALKILHLDLKPSNLLINGKGEIKIADFGLARIFDGEETFSKVSLWYRPPELLLGDKKYTESVDIWAAGCIFGELLLIQKFFAGKDEADQIRRIMEILGGITSENFPNCEKLPLYCKINFASFPKGNIHELIISNA